LLRPWNSERLLRWCCLGGCRGRDCLGRLTLYATRRRKHELDVGPCAPPCQRVRARACPAVRLSRAVCSAGNQAAKQSGAAALLVSSAQIINMESSLSAVHDSIRTDERTASWTAWGLRPPVQLSEVRAAIGVNRRHTPGPARLWGRASLRIQCSHQHSIPASKDTARDCLTWTGLRLSKADQKAPHICLLLCPFLPRCAL
jgi:hypothetical protein